eukprot:2771252-Pyramimonas_sp.AAC.1
MKEGGKERQKIGRYFNRGDLSLHATSSRTMALCLLWSSSFTETGCGRKMSPALLVASRIRLQSGMNRTRITSLLQLYCPDIFRQLRCALTEYMHTHGLRCQNHRKTRLCLVAALGRE